MKAAGFLNSVLQRVPVRVSVALHMGGPRVPCCFLLLVHVFA